MTPTEIAARLAALAKEREILIGQFNFQLGTIAGKEALLREMAAPPAPTA